MVMIRQPVATDAVALSDLVRQLGYSAEAAEMPGRLEGLRQDANAGIFLAEHQGVVAGVVTAHIIHSVHKTEPVAMLTVLVVDEKARGAGIGRQLVHHAEQWAMARGATVISLTSALRRTEAHAFY